MLFSFKRYACFTVSALLAVTLCNIASPLAFSASKPVKILAGSVRKSGLLTLEHVLFYYKTDEELRFADKKTAFQSKTRGQLPPDIAAQFARDAYAESSVEKELTQWRYHGGPAPNVITAKAHLFNESEQARLNIQMTSSIRVKVAPLLVDPKTLLVNFPVLENNGKWMSLGSQNITLDVLAAGEDYREDVARFELLPFLAEHPGQWPTELEVTVSCPMAGPPAKVNLVLTPDHFVVPTLY